MNVCVEDITVWDVKAGTETPECKLGSFSRVLLCHCQPHLG